jgi:cytochrome c oxidase subunit 2
MTLLGTISSMLATVPRGDVGGGFWMPPESSTISNPIDAIFFMIYWICVFFFVLIVVLMVIFVVRYRRRTGEAPPPSLAHHTPLELTWTIIPLILVIAIFIVGLKGYVNLAEAPQDSYEVYVTAQKWSWTFQHRNGATETDVLTIPAGRPVKLIMTSEDVLHAVFIPSFRVKQDVVPGRYTYLWFQTASEDRVDYQLFCAEYCGTEHSQMGALVRAFPTGGPFEAEMEKLANVIDEYSDEDLWKYFRDKLFGRCISCHNLSGPRKIGPSFSETAELWGKERRFRDGTSAIVDENYIRSSLLNPAGQVVEGLTPQMPAFSSLKPREILSVIEFIKHHDQAVDENGNWRPD